jgi:hypothetical protein
MTRIKLHGITPYDTDDINARLDRLEDIDLVVKQTRVRFQRTACDTADAVDGAIRSLTRLRDEFRRVADDIDTPVVIDPQHAVSNVVAIVAPAMNRYATALGELRFVRYLEAS